MTTIIVVFRINKDTKVFIEYDVNLDREDVDMVVLVFPSFLDIHLFPIDLDEKSEVGDDHKVVVHLCSKISTLCRTLYQDETEKFHNDQG